MLPYLPECKKLPKPFLHLFIPSVLLQYLLCVDARLHFWLQYAPSSCLSHGVRKCISSKKQCMESVGRCHNVYWYCLVAFVTCLVHLLEQELDNPYTSFLCGLVGRTLVQQLPDLQYLFLCMSFVCLVMWQVPETTAKLASSPPRVQ